MNNISILLAGHFAYNFKTPVRFGFLDYGTLSRGAVMQYEL